MTDTRSTHVEITGIPRDKALDPDLGLEQNNFGYRYYSPAFAQKEWERMWTRVWQIAGRVDQIPDPGDYVKYDIVHESII